MEQMLNGEGKSPSSAALGTEVSFCNPVALIA